MSSLKKAIFRKAAEEDVGHIVEYIANDNVVAAERFFDAVEETSTLLVLLPQMGSVRIFENVLLKEMRIIPVKQFEKYLIFYRVHGDMIEVIRVVHGARDLPELFR